MSGRFSVFLSLLILIPSLVFADIGPKPSLQVSVQKDGKAVDAPYLYCYDAFSLGSIYKDKHPEVREINDFIVKNDEGMGGGCSVCTEATCDTWFYGFPKNLLIVYPITTEGKAGLHVLPETKYYYARDIKALGELQQIASVQLLDNGTAITTFTPPTKTPAYFAFFLSAFISTLLVELFLAFLIWYFWLKKRKGFLLTILFMNLVSIPIVWYIIPSFAHAMAEGILIAEFFAVAAETLFIHVRHKHDISVGKALGISVLLNVCSFSVGIVSSIIVYVIASMG